MSYADYIPHRMLLNRSLRKASNELREKVDACQAEYERRVEECEAEIEAVESELEKDRQATRSMFDRELDGMEAKLRLLYDDIASYSDQYLHHMHLQRIESIRVKQIGIFKQDCAFLSKQMRLIGEEIEILVARKAELAALVNVRDIIELIDISDSLSEHSHSDDCHKLLKEIKVTLNELPDKNTPECRALKRLELIIQERAEHSYTIQYINWIIRQKKLYSAELKRTRGRVCGERSEVESGLAELNEEMSVSNHKLSVLAKKVRMHWARPTVYLKADKSFARQQRREVGNRLHDISSRHVYDPDWDALQIKRKRLCKEIEDLDERIGVWDKRRDAIIDMCKKNGVPLVTDDHDGKRDEMELVRARLEEIDLIRRKAAAEVEANQRSIANEWYEQLQVLDEELSAIESQERDSEIQKRNTLNEVSVAMCSLQDAKAADRRFFKFPPTKDVTSARSALRKAVSRYNEAKTKLAEITAKRSKKEEELSQTNAEYETRLKGCGPHPPRPSADELLEEEKLKLLLREHKNKPHRKARR